MSNLIDIIDSMGWPREQQLAAIGETPTTLADPRMRIGVDAARDHFVSAAKKLKCPDIGIQIGHKFRVATFVETGSVLHFCRSLAHAAEINGRYERLVETAGDSELVREKVARFCNGYPDFVTTTFIGLSPKLFMRAMSQLCSGSHGALTGV